MMASTCIGPLPTTSTLRMDGRILRKRKTYDQQLHEIRDFFARARAYAAGQPEKRDLRMEAMRGLFAAGERTAAGATTLFVHANDAKQIAEVIRFKRAEDLERVVLVGGCDSWMMADPLRENDIAVMCHAHPFGAPLCRGRHRPALTNCPSCSKTRGWSTACKEKAACPR